MALVHKLEFCEIHSTNPLHVLRVIGQIEHGILVLLLGFRNLPTVEQKTSAEHLKQRLNTQIVTYVQSAAANTDFMKVTLTKCP